MRLNDIALVVPSIREDSFLRFVAEWKRWGLFESVDLILMEDNPSRTFKAPSPEVHVHFCWEDIDQYEWSWIIPRRSDTVRSFAYWYAWKEGYKYLLTLDDDCYPEPGYAELDQHHLKMLERTRWFNTLNNVRPRGTPYKNLGHRKTYINHGLWTNVLDYDAPQQLVDPIVETFTHDNRIVPHGAYFSFCGMNAMWRREAMVLSYHLLMGQQKVSHTSAAEGPQYRLEKLPFDRFGDIWSGIFMKKICDHLGWAVSSGTPYIRHDRASDPFTNLRKEANGIGVNETLWEEIDRVQLIGDDPVVCYKQLGNYIQNLDYGFKEYWKQLSSAMMTWADLFIETT